MIARLLRCQRGETSLTSLLVGAVVFIAVLGASLQTFDTLVSGESEAAARTDAQDAARSALDVMARELRNLASPTQEQPEAVDLATGWDLVFQSVNPNGPGGGLNASNVHRVRYCLDAGDPADGKLWRQTQTWTTQTPPPAPSTSACPGSAWASSRLVAHRITNLRDGRQRPLFTVNATERVDVSAVHVDLFVDLRADSGPAETQLTTGVFLRNQNRRPTAAFSVTPTAQGLMLNGSESSDPEGSRLTYVWFDGATKVGTGVVFTYPVEPGSTHTITLRVYDPAGLEAIAPARVVTA